jgi:glycosyltransferase involved in cell wall biosynthesis
VKVCIDAQAALTQRAGVSRYVRGLADALATLDTDDTFVPVLFSVRSVARPFAHAIPNRIPIPRRGLQAAWRSFHWPPFDALAPRADVFHFPDFVMPPLRRGRTVLTVHDAAFRRFPGTLEARNLRHLEQAVPRSMERADAVIADTHFVAEELRDLFPDVRHRIFAIPLGIGPQWRPPTLDVVTTTLNRRGIRPPFVLTVGTLEPRKNHALLIDAFERLVDTGASLVIVGPDGWKHEALLARIASSRAASRIVRVPFVPDEELRALYAGCAVFAFPSSYEGFGFPPLEAMACGAPVVAASRAALPEIVGEGGMLLDDGHPDTWASALATLLSDHEARASLVQRGRARAATFTWESTAHETHKVYRWVLESGDRARPEQLVRN